PISPVRLNPQLPAALERIVNRALEKDPNLRHQTASDLRADLQRVKRDADSGSSAATSVAAAAALSGTATMGRGATPPGEAPTSAWRSAARRWKLILPPAVVVAALVVGAIAAVGGIVWKKRTAVQTNVQSIAVLPLANLSGDSEQDYFADGMTDELISHLAKVRALRVISRTSM